MRNPATKPGDSPHFLRVAVTAKDSSLFLKKIFT
jgi:hypothetical protein